MVDSLKPSKKISVKQKIGDTPSCQKTSSLLLSIFSYYVYNSEGLHCSDSVGLHAVGIEMNFSVVHIAHPKRSIGKTVMWQSRKQGTCARQ